MEARMCFDFEHGLADISILSRAYTDIRQPVLKLKTHSVFHDLFLNLKIA
jgi:hypothetical protein